MYGNFNVERVSLDSDAEDQCFQDLCMFIELLLHIMSKEVLDLSSDGMKSTITLLLYILSFIILYLI